MIIEMLLSLVTNLLDLLLVFELPSFPDDVMQYISRAFDYIVGGVGLLANYTPITYLISLLGLVIVLDACMYIYKTVLWLLKKIPNLNIS